MSFIGSRLTYVSYYPTIGRATSTPVSAVVTDQPGSQPEFTNIGRYDNDPNDNAQVVNASIDIAAARITYQVGQNSGSYLSGAFNGLSLSDTDGTVAPIVGVTLVAANGVRLGIEDISLDENGIYVNVAGRSYSSNASLTVDAIFANGSTISGTSFADVLRGQSSSELIYGYGGTDVIYGLGGNDTIYGNQGNDTLFGNLGNDTLFGGQDDDIVYGGQNDDLVLGNLGADTLLGNFGNDTVFGGQGNDLIYGGQGDDVLFGDLGRDTLYGDLGNDVLTGGADADRFVFGLGSGTDVVTDFNQAAGDRIGLSGQGYAIGSTAGGAAILTLSGGGTVQLNGVTAAQVNSGFFG
ncbi:hypothetical protein MPOCJGCO_3863 [Methylobacterium trifolii]|uniref:Calcium-binding protein n=1 Tax=Methylobacterium trifolii TaxID=1003092 RepID=A0ABQ4U2M6_9HYPH|nr:hypothetical protein MPOCJGCO_3863 [Methylobacterium trifolii]